MKLMLKPLIAIGLIAILAFTVVIGFDVAMAQSECPSAHCIYLPLISKAKPPVFLQWRTLGYRVGGDYYITGELHTDPSVTTRPVYDVQVDVYINDEWHASTSPLLNAIFPGHPVPISPVTIPSYSVDPRITSWSFLSTIDYQPTTVVSINVDSGFIISRVSGEVRNDNSEVMHSIRVVAWSLDQCSFTTPVYATLEKTSLSPGETTSYSVELWAEAYCPGTITTAEVVGQGILEPSPAP